jgi:hypothetical protein
MTRTRIAAVLLIAATGTLGAVCEPLPPRPESRAFATTPGSCDGSFDYGDEFEIANVQNGAMRPVGLDVWEIDLLLEVRNLGDASFRALSVTPDFATRPDLGVVASPAPLAADFGPIDPLGEAWSTAALRIRVPAANFGAVIEALLDGSVPLVVHGDEANVLAPGVEIHAWTSTEDALYGIGAEPAGGFGLPPNGDPGDGPFAPGQEFSLLFLTPYSDDMPTVFDDFEPGALFYLVEDPSHPLGGENENLPDAFDRVRVIDAERLDSEDDFFTAWLVTVKRTDAESLPAIYQTASFCTGASHQIDLPVQASRLTSLDGDAVEPEASDSNPQGIRFNDLPFGGGAVTVSGQVQGHVLAPSLGLRIRDGHVSTRASFDTDLALTAELKASGSEVAMESLELWSLCFPLPEFSAGPVSVSTNLQITHTLGAEASFTAGAVVGFQKHFDSGFAIACESGGVSGAGCSTQGRRTDSPIQFTPPQLTNDAAAHARVETTLAASLNFFSPYPACDLGPGLFAETTAYGEIDVTPTQEPWWEMGYGLDVSGGIDLDVLGIDIPRIGEEVVVASFAGPAAEIGSPRTSGEDQRWSVAIDDIDVPNGVSASKIAALTDGSSVAIASEPIGGRTPIVKLDRFGAMEWVKEFQAGREPTRVRALADGSVIVVGADTWLARVDASGNLLWSFEADLSRPEYAFAECVLFDVAPLETAPGVYDFVAVGRMGNSLVTDYDACALRANADGTLAWARYYPTPGVNVFYGATAMQDGHVMAVGTDAWYWVGTRRVPLFAKLEPATGDVVFWKALPMARLAELNAVTEAADGTLYAAGATFGIIYTTGTSLVAKMAPDGSDAHHATIYQDESWEALLDFETWVDTEGGDTPYDGYFDIAPSGDGFVIAGSTGLGVDSAARVAKINAKLGTEWIATFDGAEPDALTGVAPAADGIFVSGFSASLPEADGGSGENQLWISKLPFTGALEFQPGVGVTARFVAPAVRDGSLDPGVNPTDSVTVDNPYTTAEAIVESSGPNSGLLVNASAYCVERLTDTGRDTTTDTCSD